MDKEKCGTYTHSGILFSKIKIKIRNLASWDSMDGNWVFNGKLNKSEEERTNTIWFHTYMEFFKMKKKLKRYREQISGYQRRRALKVNNGEKSVNCMVIESS